MQIVINEVKNTYPAAQPRPIPIDKNKYTSSSGSFIGVLNLTIESAPTNPSDNANEDFTTKITKKTIELKIGIIFPRFNFPATELPYLI